ncbi:hypothetical protein ZIOFF_050700 [Zingiber officinale]|uniref:dUTP diphosphatase n=1 Tax=Zingiber officinale TaxID=94328 RepID=A0A8J5FS04_ZINOF|nr:hypothetical protein ZIOFF_050700 [Zingiber officinale]
MLDGSVSLQFDQYQVATSSSPPKFNSRDEEIQSDEEELTSHIIAVLVEEERGPELLVKRIHSLAQLPVRRTPGAAGYDISITHAQDIPALGRSLLQTGICIQIPQNTYARVAPGSSAAMRGIIIMGGVIDSDYRGEVKVMAYNTTNDDIFLNKQECIAQLIIEQITSPMVREVELLGSTERGAFGFGSTTKNTASGLVFGFGNQTPQEPQVCSSNKANPFCQGCHYCCSDEEHAAGYDDYVTTYPEIQAQKGKEVDQPVKRVSGYQPLSEEQLLALQKKARQYAIEQHRYYEEEAYLNLVDAPPSMERSLAITRRRGTNRVSDVAIRSKDDRSTRDDLATVGGKGGVDYVFLIAALGIPKLLQSLGQTFFSSKPSMRDFAGDIWSFVDIGEEWYDTFDGLLSSRSNDFRQMVGSPKELESWVSVDIKFDEGISACLEYLEAIPWSEYEEDKVISILGKLHIQQLREPIREIFQRVSVQPSTFANADPIFLGILDGVLQSKDKKARRDIKTLISGLLKEDVNQSNIQYNKLDVSKDSLYYLCQKCLDHLMQLFSEAANIENVADRASLMGEVAREADNVQWLVDILINKRIADEFVALWADQSELSTCHSKIPCMYRFEISRITAQLCVAIGRGHILVSKDAKISLLRTWLEALYDDFGWMKRACRDFDKKMVEDGLCATILTLPMVEQQSILLRWFDCFLNNGDNCPNMQRAFVVWWRRAFVRQYQGDQASSQLQNVVSDDHT